MAKLAQKRDSLREIRDILSCYRKALKKHIRVKKVILFGSYTQGTAHKDSDIDVAVISEDFTGDIFKDDRFVMRIAREIDLRIEPHPFRPEDFRDENPLVWEIKKTGISIP